MNLALVLFLGGAVVIAWIYFWSRQRQGIKQSVDIDAMMNDVPAADKNDALLVSQEQGRLIYVNDTAREMLRMNGGQPHLEQVASMAEPSSAFLQLFAGEGQASFQVNNRWVEASSHRVPAGAETRTVVVLRELAVTSSNSDVLDMGTAMTIINEIGETVDVTQGMEPVLQAILTIVSKYIPFDAGEISLWHEDDQVLYQRGWVGDATYLLALTEAGGYYRLGEGITGWIARHQEPVVVEGGQLSQGLEPKLLNENPYESFVGVPVNLRDRFIGTMELASMQVGAFSQGDMALLQAIANPVGVSIYNADMMTRQSERINDIAGLQRVVAESQSEDGKDTDISRVYDALNQRVATLLEADMCGIMLYDSDRQGLVMQLPVYGLPEALVRSLFIPLEDDSPQRYIWENQPYWISNDVEDEPLVESLGLQPIVSLAGINNTAWMPLQLSNERIGVLVVSNKRTEGGFTPHDIQDLRVLAAQASIVIENLRLYEREKRMDTELVGLQEITNAIGALSHETEFYSEITERIANLMNIEMVGILLYDENQEELVSQLPFHGISDEIVRDYTIPLPSGSVMRELWEDEPYWYSNHVQSDTLVFEAGLDQMAEQAGVQKTMIAVLQASGRRLGVVQISNKLSGEDFTDNDARLLMIFATQAAAIIENARLYNEARASAEQAQGLRRLAEMAGNVLTTQETFGPVLQEIARLMRVEMVFINVLDQQKGSLVTYPRWVYGQDLSEPIVQDIYSPGFEHSVALSHRPYISQDVHSDENLLPSYRQVAERFGIKSAVLVPLVFGERSLGELGIANAVDQPFTRDTLEVMKLIAAQVASALDRLLLYEATGENLNRRVEELDAISRVSNELTITLNLDRVLEVIRNEAINATEAEDCSIAMLEPSSKWPSREEPLVQRRIGYDNIVSLADVEQETFTRRSEPVLITDYQFSTMTPVPPHARSALVVPVLYQEEMVGIIHLFHSEPNHFDDRGSAFLMTMAVKASLGYGNAARYQEQLDRSERLRRRVDQLNRIFELGHMFQTNTDPVSILEAIAYSVQQSVGFDNVVMLLHDQDSGVMRRVAQAGLPLREFEESKSNTINHDDLETLFRQEYRISESYFFPVEKVDDWYMPGVKALSTEYDGNRSIRMASEDAWRDGDMLVVRLLGPSGNLIGLMSLDRPQNNLRPDRGTVEVLEIFANQAASTIENTRLYLASLSSAEQESQLNELMEAVSSTLDIEEILRSVASGALSVFSFSRMTLALLSAEGGDFEVLRVAVTEGQQLGITRERQQTLDNTALGHSYETGRDYLYYAGDAAVEQFSDLRDVHFNSEQTSLILPLVTGGEALGALHIGSSTAYDSSFSDYRPFMRRMAQMIASAVQNARLFDQAVNLQVLNESVVESIQQGIIVLDDNNRLITVNSFMNERFGWQQAEAVNQDIFMYRPEMANLIREELAHVLAEGTPQENINQTTTDVNGQMIVSNFYLYPLRFGSSVRGAVILIEDVTERSRLEQAMEARANQLAALTDVSSRITSSLERDEVVQLALEEMGWLIPHTAMTLWRRNGSYMVLEGATNQTVDYSRSLNLRFLFGEYDITEQVVESQRVVSVSRDVELPEGLTMHEGANSWMGVPLVNQGHVVGMLMLTDNDTDAYESKSDQNIAFAFASQVAIALANADLFEQTFDRTNELGTLLEAAQATSMTTDLDSVLRTVVELMFSALDMDECAIMTWYEVDNQLEVQLDMNRQGDADIMVPRGTRFDLDEYPARMRALRDREVVVIMSGDENSPYPKEMRDLENSSDAARMLVPLVVNETSRGLIQLGTQSRERITQQKVRLARALGSQVAVAIENARLSAETTAHFEESLVINDLSRAISSTLNLDDMLEVVREQVPDVTGASELYLALYDEDTGQIDFPLAVSKGESYNIQSRNLANDEVSFIIRHRRPLNLGADYYSPDELRHSLGIENGESDAKSYLGVPLIAGDRVYGVLAVRDTERTRAFTINEQRILTTVGSQLGAAIQNAQLFERVSTFADELNEQVAARTQELEEERDRIDTLYQITSELSRTLDMDRLMPRALGMVAKAVSAQDGVIMQLDPITDQLYSRAVLNPEYLPQDDEGVVSHPADRIARWIIAEDEHVMMVDDLLEKDYWDSEAPGAAGWRSALAVLLETNEELLGVMVFLSNEVGAFHESHMRLMVAAANQVASSINNAELYKMIREQAERLGTLLRAEQEEADKNKAILEGIADGVVLADESGNIILFNSAAERILQTPREQAVGRPLSKIAGAHGASAEAWAEALERRMANPEMVNSSDLQDERVQLGDRTVSVLLSPVYTGERFLGTVSVFRDITREVEAERSKSEFVANVSHEFRTPLTSIKGYNDLLLMGAFGALEDQQKHMLDTIRDNVTRLAALVEDVLNISQIDSGKERLQITDVDINNVIQDVLHNLWSRQEHQGKDLTVSFEAQDNLPSLEGDHEKMLRIFSNVIDNAFNYTLAGGTITIRAEPHTDGRSMLIAVQDTGVGIPEDFHDKIWQRFERHDETAVTLDVAGTGLGLPIVQELVEMHNGDIWFESQEGVGTTFYVTLPFQQPAYYTRAVVQSTEEGE